MKPGWPNHTWLGHGTKLKNCSLGLLTKAAMKKALKHVHKEWDKKQTVPITPKQGFTKKDRMVWAVYRIAKLAELQIKPKKDRIF